MGAKVSNFYIFDDDEIAVKENPCLPVCIQRGAFLLFNVAIVPLFFT
jgi:hypothetical protein